MEPKSGVMSEPLLISSFFRLEERHASQIKAMSKEPEELRSQLSQMEKELQYLSTELEAQKEANVRSPSNTMKNLVERLKAQLALKEKQLKVTERSRGIQRKDPLGSLHYAGCVFRGSAAVCWLTSDLMSDLMSDLIFVLGVQALSKAMLEFRAQMTSQAEQQIIANAAQKEEALNVQQIVDKQTKELKVRALKGSTHTEGQMCSDEHIKRKLY